MTVKELVEKYIQYQETINYLICEKDDTCDSLTKQHISIAVEAMLNHFNNINNKETGLKI